jgi:hypothetical protein
METVLQSALPEQNVRFRNMSTSGDRPNSYPRSPGQISMTTYLQHVKPDVVFGLLRLQRVVREQAGRLQEAARRFREEDARHEAEWQILPAHRALQPHRA